jgi:hypothetical protein
MRRNDSVNMPARGALGTIIIYPFCTQVCFEKIFTGKNFPEDAQTPAQLYRWLIMRRIRKNNVKLRFNKSSLITAPKGGRTK